VVKLIDVVLPILIAIDPETILISASESHIFELYAKHFQRHLHNRTVGLRNVEISVKSEEFSNAIVLNGAASYVTEEAFESKFIM
jgi:hypothetical protein